MRKLLSLLLLMSLTMVGFAQINPPVKYINKYRVEIPGYGPNTQVYINLKIWYSDGTTENKYISLPFYYETYVWEQEDHLNKEVTWIDITSSITVRSSSSATGECTKRASFGWSVVADFGSYYSSEDHPLIIEEDPNWSCHSEYYPVPKFVFRMLPNILIADKYKTDPADNIYCDNDRISLKTTYTGGTTYWNTVYWQYRLDNGDFKFVETNGLRQWGNETYFTLRDMFGSDYPNYLNKRIEFRAVYSDSYLYGDMYNYPELTKPDEGSNILAYYFSKAAPQPQKVAAVIPSCSNDSARTMKITFDRPLNDKESITQLYVGKIVNGIKDRHDQYTSPITSLPADNTFTWNNIEPMAAGDYYMVVSAKLDNVDECNKTEYKFTVTPPLPIAFTTAQSNVKCHSGNDGTITITAAGGAGNYSYSKDNGANWQTGNTFTGLMADTYTLVVKDGNSCISLTPQIVTITQPVSALAASIDTYKDPLGATTNDGKINIRVSGGTPGYTFLWSNGATTQNITNAGGGTNTVTITDANGCITTATINLLAPDPILITFTETPISCYGLSDGALSASVTGGVKPYTLSWGSSYISNLAKNTYRLTVIDANGISATSDYPLEEPPLLTLSTTTTSTNCYGDKNGSFTATAAGGTNPYTYSIGPVVNDLPAGNYPVKVIDGHGCTANTTAIVNTPAELLIDGIITTPTRHGSTDGSIAVTITGGTAPYTKSWTDPLTDLPAGIYTLDVTDAHGCTATATFNVVEPEPLTLSVTLKKGISCHGLSGGILDAGIAGGVEPYTINWSNNAHTATISNLPAGKYDVSVIDQSGGVVNGTYTITEPPLLQLSLSATGVSCGGESDGAVISTTTGGITPYTYSWNTGAASADIDHLDGGLYTLHITDDNGCILSSSTTVVAPNALDMTSMIIPPVCHGDATGSITLTTTGGHAPYSYLWKTGEQADKLDNLQAGTYTVKMTDFSGCILNKSFTLTQPPAISIALGADRTLCEGQSLNLDAAIPGGVHYAWTSDNGFTATTPAVIIDATGTYHILATDNKGCQATDAVHITKDATAISADFLMSTEAYTGESIIAVNVSSPKADRIIWTLPEGADIHTQNDTLVELTFSNAGHYVITMTTFRGNCEATTHKDVMVVTGVSLPDVNTQHNSLFKQAIVRPNPNTGQFYADVEAAEDITVSYRLLDIQRNRVVSDSRGQLLKDVVTAVPFSVTGQPAGVYVLLMESVKEKKALKVLIL
jgi:hypothetical protein